MKELNFEQMEIISAGLTKNQKCMIAGGVAVGACIFGAAGAAFGAAVVVEAFFYGCFD